MIRRRLLLCALAPVALDAARAQPWPTRPIRLVVAYPPGGVSDEMARLLARGLALRLRTAVTVEHQPGAGGVVAMEALSRAPADGHTLCYCAISPLVLAPLLGPLGFDPQRDIAPVIGVMDTPVLVLAHPSFAPSTVAEVVAFARAAPGRVRWASSGLATVGHLVLEQIRAASGADFTHVPYKGGGQQINDALGGQFEIFSSNVAALQIQYVREGRLKAIAVGAPTRLSALPEVPTLAEAGFASANLVSSFGIFAPGATPSAVIARLNHEFNALLAEPELRARLAAVSNLATGGSPDEFRRRIAEALVQARALAPVLVGR